MSLILQINGKLHVPPDVPCVSQLSYWNAMNLPKFREPIKLLLWCDSSLHLGEGRSLNFDCWEVSLVTWPQQTWLSQTPHFNYQKWKLLQMNRIAVLNQAQGTHMDKEDACTLNLESTINPKPNLDIKPENSSHVCLLIVGSVPQSACSLLRWSKVTLLLAGCNLSGMAISMFLICLGQCIAWLVTERWESLELTL